MGTKIQSKSYLPEFFSMRDLNEDSSWPLFYGDKTLLPNNGQYYDPFTPRSSVDGYPGHDKDDLKQKMLEHEAVFKNQVCELHRLYRIQRDMMQEVRIKEANKHRASMEPASSSSLHVSQVPLDEARKWHMAGFPLTYGRTSISGVEIVNSPTTCMRTNSTQPGQFPFQNGPMSKDSEGPRPSKVRKKLLDLRLPADEYIDIQEGENSKERKESDLSGYASSCNPNSGPESRTRLLFSGGRVSKGSNGLADLNEPVQIEALSSVDFLGRSENGFSTNSYMESKVITNRQLPHTCDAGPTRSNIYSATQSPRPDKLFLPSHRSDYYNSREDDMWRDGPRHGLESSVRNRDPFVGTSCFATSWAQSVSSWATPTTSSAQNVIPSETRPKPFFPQRSESTLNGLYNASVSGSSYAGSKPAKDINLNESIPKDHVSALPWLKPKPVGDSNVISARSDAWTVKKVEIPETRPVGKILGIPIFEKSRVLENGPSPTEENSVERKNGLIDINVACVPDEQISSQEPIFGKEKSKNDFQFDLNSCVSDCEDPPSSTDYEPKTTGVRITLEIDLELPVFLESEDDDDGAFSQSLRDVTEPIKTDEVLRNAAETIFAISSSGPRVVVARPEASLAEALLWFADTVSSCVNEPSSGAKKCTNREIDDFEAMTLRIPETREEDYMRERFETPIIEEENAGSALTTRPRRGQSRRGRQRRDFQRDILPGLTSLSRHEVTEDLQIFGGLMRATGHSWNLGLTRRKTGGRGRRRAIVAVEDNNNVIASSVCARLVKQVDNNNNNNCIVEGGGLEDRSLTGWGKTTRRPRRQRCPAGNLSTILLT